MSRVWRHFLKNLAWPFGFVTYIIAVVAAANYANTLIIGAGVGVMIVFVVFPILAYLIRDLWQDAKEKVERENYEMMRSLKGNKFDY